MVGGEGMEVTPSGPVEANRVVRACVHAARKALEGMADGPGDSTSSR